MSPQHPSVLKKGVSDVSTEALTTVDGPLDDTNSNGLLPLIQRAFPKAESYSVIKTIIQANAVGYILEIVESDCQPNKKVFMKIVDAPEYVSTKKDWSDLRRTLMYARTEGRFYRNFLPKLRQRGFTSTPHVYLADYNLEGLIDETEPATASATSCAANGKEFTALKDDPTIHGKGGLLVLECVDDATHYQDSPLTPSQCQQCLKAAAQLHAATWQDTELLQIAQDNLSLASFHLKMRNPKELKGIVDSWKDFSAAFKDEMEAVGLVGANFDELGVRIERLADWTSQEVTRRPTDPYATIIHGDYKSMNVFLPRESDGKPVLVDFASCGIGLGMSDVAMHVRHAVRPKDLVDSGEQELVKFYWKELTTALKERGIETDYPWDVAWYHYKLAVIDYFRFFLARMWKSATPATMLKKKDNKNVSLINRSPDSAMSFLRNVEAYITEVELQNKEDGNKQCSS